MRILNNLFKRQDLKSTVNSIQAFQIVYDTATRAARDSDFEALDNSNSARTDWYEYWPIRNFLENTLLEESTLYGFVSPLFKLKTHLTGAEVYQFIESSDDADVFTFSPGPCHGALFLNAYEHGEFFDPGSFKVAAKFFEKIGEQVDLHGYVNHSGNIVFSNYFFAKPRFWREWLRICNLLFEVAEVEDALGEQLRESVIYGKQGNRFSHVQRKVFIMERIAPYLLANHPGYKITNFPFRRMPISEAAKDFIPDVYRMDELKRKYLETGEDALLEHYRSEQSRLVPAIWLPDQA